MILYQSLLSISYRPSGILGLLIILSLGYIKKMLSYPPFKETEYLQFIAYISKIKLMQFLACIDILLIKNKKIDSEIK